MSGTQQQIQRSYDSSTPTNRLRPPATGARFSHQRTKYASALPASLLNHSVRALWLCSLCHELVHL